MQDNISRANQHSEGGSHHPMRLRTVVLTGTEIKTLYTARISQKKKEKLKNEIPFTIFSDFIIDLKCDGQKEEKGQKGCSRTFR